MKVSTWWRNKGFGGTAAVAALATLSIACSDASALAPAPARAGLPVVTDNGEVDTGTQAQGYALGRRNGDIIVGRLQDRTVGTRGCSAIPQLETALVSVIRNVRRPHGNDDMARGFYRGYLDAVREGVRDARTICHTRPHSSGAFAGELYGALLCEVSKVSVDLATSIEIDWLYDGWSGSSTEVIQECRTSATVTLRSCDGDVADLLSLAVERSCSDSDL